jgi:hypothetical protein
VPDPSAQRLGDCQQSPGSLGVPGLCAGLRQSGDLVEPGPILLEWETGRSVAVENAVGLPDPFHPGQWEHCPGLGVRPGFGLVEIALHQCVELIEMGNWEGIEQHLTPDVFHDASVPGWRMQFVGVDRVAQEMRRWTAGSAFSIDEQTATVCRTLPCVLRPERLRPRGAGRSTMSCSIPATAAAARSALRDPTVTDAPALASARVLSRPSPTTSCAVDAGESGFEGLLLLCHAAGSLPVVCCVLWGSRCTADAS